MGFSSFIGNKRKGENTMDIIKKEKVIERGDNKYPAYYITGPVSDRIGKHLVLVSNNIVASNIKPIKVANKTFEYYDIELPVSVYKIEPAIIAFDNLYGKNFNDNMRLFKKRFKRKLKCKYILGRFNLFAIGRKYQTDKALEAEKGFCVALFGKSEQEILDFTVDFLELSGSQYAFIKGDVFDAPIVQVGENEGYGPDFFLVMDKNEIGQSKRLQTIEKFPIPKSMYSTAYAIRTGFREVEQHIIRKTRIPMLKKNETLFNDKGGMIVFGSGTKDPKIEPQKIARVLKNIVPRFIAAKKSNNHHILNKTDKNEGMPSQELGVAYSFGNRYITSYGGIDTPMFSRDSLTMEIFGLNSEELEKLALLFHDHFSYKRLLVKDYNNNDIYIVR